MKDIVAALEAKRVVAAAAIALLCMLVAGPALAQQGARWTDPSGSWSIDLATSNWGSADGLPAGGPALVAVPMQPPPDSEIRICLVDQTVERLPANPDEAEVRQRAAHIDVAQAQAAFPRAGLTQTVVGHSIIDGEAVATVEGLSGRNRFRGRLFVTPAAGQAVLSAISCISTPGMPAAPDAEVDAILNSLHFQTASAPK